MVMEKLEQIFQTVFNDSQIHLEKDMGPETIEGWDSLSQIILVEEIEKEFNISIDLDDALGVKTVGDFLIIIEQELKVIENNE